MDLCDALPSCQSSASASQGNFWPGQPGATMWPGQATQPPPCWPGQPNTPCWPGTQPALTPAPAPAPAPVPDPAPAPAPVLAPAPAPVSVPVQPCQQQCWPGLQPSQMLPPAPSTAQPAWPVNPSQGGWPYNPGQSGWPAQNPSLTPPQWPMQPAPGAVMVPYNLNLMRGVYDKMMMTIRGQVKPDARMFTVNFLRGNDIALHINPRFNDAGRPAMVRNSKVGERWGKEERDLQSPFPLAPGQPFEMKILCTYNEFKVAVNNTPLFEFRHRVRELNQINRINILHDIILTYVNVDTLP